VRYGEAEQRSMAANGAVNYRANLRNRTPQPRSGDASARVHRRRLALTLQCELEADDLPARGLLRRWIVSVLERDAVLTVRFVGSAEGRALNRRYRDSDHATNVLSFVYDDVGDAVSGDLVLCLPVLRKEAKQQGKTLVAHCAHLVMHGVLHVQGYDHETAAHARLMEARERSALASFGFADPYAASH